MSSPRWLGALLSAALGADVATTGAVVSAPTAPPGRALRPLPTGPWLSFDARGPVQP